MNLMQTIALKPFHQDKPRKLGLVATLWISNAAWLVIAAVMGGLLFTATEIGSSAAARFLAERKHLSEVQAENARLMAERDMKIARLVSFQTSTSSEVVALATTLHSVFGSADNGKQAKFLEIAIPEALRLQVQEGIPASAVIAQSIYESAYGSSQLAREYHNYFGLKAFGNWRGTRAQDMPTRDSGVATHADFRSYSSVAEGFDGYVDFLRNSGRYDRAFSTTTGEQFIAELLRGGYCPDGDYLTRIREIMKRHNLQKLDEQYKQMSNKLAKNTAPQDPS